MARYSPGSGQEASVRSPEGSRGSGAERFVPPDPPSDRGDSRRAPRAPTAPPYPMPPPAPPLLTEDAPVNDDARNASPFQTLGQVFAEAAAYVFSTHRSFATGVLILMLGAILGVLVAGWIRGLAFGASEAWGLVIAAAGALGVLLAGTVGLVVLHWLTVWLGGTLRPRAPRKPKRHTPVGEKLFHVITFLAAVWTGYTSCHGFQLVFFSPEEGWRYWGVPGLAGVIGAGFVYTFWTTLLERMEMASFLQKVVLLGFIAPMGAAIIFGMSTATSVLGVGGDAANTYHLRESADLLQQTLNDIRRTREGEYERLLPIARQMASRFERLAVQEETHGTLTSAAGAGSVSVYLRDLSQVAGGIADHLQDARQNEASEISALNDALLRLREALSDRGDALRKNLETLVRDLNAVQARLGKIASASPIEYFAFQIGTLREIRPLSADSINRNFASSQREVVNNLQNEKNALLDDITSTLAQMSKNQVVSVPRFRPMHDLEAILVYWRQIWLSWAIAIATDIGPLLWILVAAVMPTGSYLVKAHQEEERAGFPFLEEDAA